MKVCVTRREWDREMGRGVMLKLPLSALRVMSVWSHYPALSPRTNSHWPPSFPHRPIPLSLHPFLTTSTAHVLTTRLAHLLSNDCHSLLPVLQIPFISTIVGSHSDHSASNALGVGIRSRTREARTPERMVLGVNLWEWGVGIPIWMSFLPIRVHFFMKLSGVSISQP